MMSMIMTRMMLKIWMLTDLSVIMLKLMNMMLFMMRSYKMIRYGPGFQRVSKYESR